jgi:chorismate mutase/prephenate dehydratase
MTSKKRISKESLRARIDGLDEKLVRLLAERAEAAEAIGRLKRRQGATAFDPGRERAVRTRLARLSRGRFPAPALEAVFREIVSASRAIGQPTRVGFLGRTGSLAHWAALHRFGSSSNFAGYDSGEALLSALESGDQEFAVVSLEGQPEDPGFDAFDVLLSSRARIYGEFFLEGGVVLLGRSTRGARRVYGQPGLLALCSRWLQSRRPRLAVQALATSQEAAERAARNRSLCIATPALAGTGMRVLTDQVADAPRLRQRYFILSLSEPAPSEADKMAFLAVLPHRPGALHGVLGVFARRKINLVSIETRASQGRPWQHVFLLEIEGRSGTPRIDRALAALRRQVDFYKDLGSFPADTR